MPVASTQGPVDPSAQSALIRELAHVAVLHDQRHADARLARSLERLSAWQARRLTQTYADLHVQPRYAAAIEFFETDLYGSTDFARRDADLARVVPILVRTLPERVIATVAQAMELNTLSQELDRALLARLPGRDRPFTVADYCRAYRLMGNRAGRERQIDLITDIGGALDRFVRMPLLHAALVMMRQPARLVGMLVLHDFLERGFTAFRNMHGADVFLATIRSRETALMNAIFGGDDAPFVDPQVAAER